MSRTTAKKQALSPQTWAELQSISDVLALAAFCTDAKRILEGIDEVCRIYPDIEQRIHKNVTAANNWTCHDDTLPAVLTHAQARLQDLLNNSTEA
jgi:hypothetical protein